MNQKRAVVNFLYVKTAVERLKAKAPFVRIATRYLSKNVPIARRTAQSGTLSIMSNSSLKVAPFGRGTPQKRAASYLGRWAPMKVRRRGHAE